MRIGSAASRFGYFAMARGLDINADYNDIEDDGGGGGSGEDMRVTEWEDGLPSADDLTPLSQPLIPAELASAFSITPEPSRTLLDVHRATQTTVSSLRRQPNAFGTATATASHRRIPSFAVPVAVEDRGIAGMEEEEGEGDGDGYGDGGGTSGSSSSAAAEAEAEDRAGGALLAQMSDLQQQQASRDQGGARRGDVGVAKRARLVWTPQLHRRFVEVVAHLGVANAVPKTIMQLMNVEGLTRENVASHLQKYRLYLKRTHGHEDAGTPAGPSPSASFASSAYLRQPQPRLPTPADGSGSLVRVAQAPTSSHAILVPQPVRHGGERPMGWQIGNSSNAAVPHRARVAPNNSS